MYYLLRPTDETRTSFGEVGRFYAFDGATAAGQPGDRIEWRDDRENRIVVECMP